MSNLDKTIQEKQKNVSDLERMLAELKEKKRIMEGGKPITDEDKKSGRNFTAREFKPGAWGAPEPAPEPEHKIEYGYADDTEWGEEGYYFQQAVEEADELGVEWSAFMDMYESILEEGLEDDYDKELAAYEAELDTEQFELDEYVPPQPGTSKPAAPAAAAAAAPAPPQPPAPKRPPPFEVMRRAKHGDLAGVQELESSGFVDTASFTDNKRRTPLHYAADSGCIALVRHLVVNGTPHTPDDAGMFPVDFATLSLHQDIVDFLRENAKNVTVRSIEDITKACAPNPPSIFIGTPAPARPKPSPSEIWGDKAPTPAPGGITTTVYAPEGDFDDVVGDVFSLLGTVQDPHLAGHTTRYHTKLQFKRLAKHCTNAVAAAGDDVVAYATALPVPALVHKGKPLRGGAAVVGSLRVDEAHRGKGVTQDLVRKLKSSLGDATLVFRSSRVLPFAPACPTKVYRRPVAPRAVFSADAALRNHVLPDWESSPSLAKGDGLLKWTPQNKTITPSFEEVSEDDAAAIVAAITTIQQQKSEAFIPFTPELAEHVLFGAGTRCFARKLNGQFVDVLALHESVVGNDDADLCVASIVFAALGQLQPEVAVEQACNIAATELDVQVLTARPHCGLTDSALRRNFFDEVPNSAESIYITGLPAPIPNPASVSMMFPF